MQAYTSRQYGYSIDTTNGISLGNTRSSGDDHYALLASIVNSKSINLTPFSQIRMKVNARFANSGTGVGGRGYLVFLNTSKSTIKTSSTMYSNYETDTDWYFDVSDINEHAFFYTWFQSNQAIDISSSRYFYIKEIEFIK